MTNAIIPIAKSTHLVDDPRTAILLAGGSHLEVAVVQAVEDVQAVGGLRAVGRMGKAH